MSRHVQHEHIRDFKVCMLLKFRLLEDKRDSLTTQFHFLNTKLMAYNFYVLYVIFQYCCLVKYLEKKKRKEKKGEFE